MKRSMVALAGLALLLGGVGWAQEAKTKAEAQAQVDAGMAKSCDMARSQTLAKKEICPEEAAKLEPVDCSKRESRKTVDFLAVNSACQAKVREAAAKSGKAPRKSTPSTGRAETGEGAKAEVAEAKTPAAEVSCKALDESGKTVAEAEQKRSALSCRAELRQKVTKDLCGAGKVLKLSFVSKSDGKEASPESFRVTCK